ncbi:hypothetical protein P153DRAFT_383998 [Dothidotthia symphoricarpi CBS 119687]|uniref:Uncharacterized protein n=1 Tax=Dothidotthia symphoricarpi CBS 119687 TaxID=1392245 RepID=A0A6A6AHP2_9PLEO|nr:uncharacterized protein P153DRAFT_383998 [Dothidotthia symphoricarpi CBS 119687]KAF2130773.1 hypothetical protein P153DRAFT_383998 [Dothidotthia symphoricarpi CBS 119687]
MKSTTIEQSITVCLDTSWHCHSEISSDGSHTQGDIRALGKPVCLALSSNSENGKLAVANQLFLDRYRDTIDTRLLNRNDGIYPLAANHFVWQRRLEDTYVMLEYPFHTQKRTRCQYINDVFTFSTDYHAKPLRSKNWRMRKRKLKKMAINSNINHDV